MTTTLALLIGIAFFWSVGRLGEVTAKSAAKSAKKAWKKNKRKRKKSDRMEAVQAYTAAGMGYVADRIRQLR